MSLTHLFDRPDDALQVGCAEDEPTLWLRSMHESVSVELTPRVIARLEAAIAQARKFPVAEAA
jgi:hypothetical protein